MSKRKLLSDKEGTDLGLLSEFQMGSELSAFLLHPVYQWYEMYSYTVWLLVGILGYVHATYCLLRKYISFKCMFETVWTAVCLFSLTGMNCW